MMAYIRCLLTSQRAAYTRLLRIHNGWLGTHSRLLSHVFVLSPYFNTLNPVYLSVPGRVEGRAKIKRDSLKQKLKYQRLPVQNTNHSRVGVLDRSRVGVGSMGLVCLIDSMEVRFDRYPSNLDGNPASAIGIDWMKMNRFDRSVPLESWWQKYL